MLKRICSPGYCNGRRSCICVNGASPGTGNEGKNAVLRISKGKGCSRYSFLVPAKVVSSEVGAAGSKARTSCFIDFSLARDLT